jgi:hypothetical protein
MGNLLSLNPKIHSLPADTKIFSQLPVRLAERAREALAPSHDAAIDIPNGAGDPAHDQASLPREFLAHVLPSIQ